MLTLNRRVACNLQNDENKDCQSEDFFVVFIHNKPVCPPHTAGGHGSLQVSEEKGDQLILLRTSCERVRALPGLQPQQGQRVNA